MKPKPAENEPFPELEVWPPTFDWGDYLEPTDTEHIARLFEKGPCSGADESNTLTSSELKSVQETIETRNSPLSVDIKAEHESKFGCLGYSSEQREPLEEGQIIRTALQPSMVAMVDYVIEADMIRKASVLKAIDLTDSLDNKCAVMVKLERKRKESEVGKPSPEMIRENSKRRRPNHQSEESKKFATDKWRKPKAVKRLKFERKSAEE